MFRLRLIIILIIYLSTNSYKNPITISLSALLSVSPPPLIASLHAFWIWAQKWRSSGSSGRAEELLALPAALRWACHYCSVPFEQTPARSATCTTCYSDFSSEPWRRTFSFLPSFWTMDSSTASSPSDRRNGLMRAGSGRRRAITPSSTTITRWEIWWCFLLSLSRFKLYLVNQVLISASCDSGRCWICAMRVR